MPKTALIIGGGICGLTTAIALTKAGHNVKLFEQNKTIAEVGAGFTLWANGTYALKQLSLHDRVIEQGQQVTSFQFFANAGRVGSDLSLAAIDKEMGVPSLSIQRGCLIEALESAIDKSRVHLDHRLVSYKQNDDYVTALFADGNEERGDILVGCDGFHSKIRAQMYPNETPRYAGYTCWRGIAHGAGDLVKRGSILHFFGKGGQVGILDVGTDTVCWYATGNAPKGIKDTFEQRKRDVTARFTDWSSPVPEVLKLTETGRFLKNDIYDRNPISKWFDGRALLLGDAAHPTTPNLGQGACQAIEDAVVLGQCLTSTDDYARAFATFSRLRQKRTNKIVLASRRAGDIAQISNPLLLALRDLTMESIMRTFGQRDFEESVNFKV